MKRTALVPIILATAVAGATPAVAAEDTLVYELSAVAGDYPLIQSTGEPRFYRQQIIVYHGPLAHIEAMRVIVEGEAETGLMVCELLPTEIDTVVTGMDVSTSIRRMMLFEYWLGGDVVYENGVFSTDHPLHPLANHGIEYLRDSEYYVVTQSFGPTGSLPECRDIAPLPWLEGRIERAVLYVDVTYPVGTAPTTWGRIKALYQ